MRSISCATFRAHLVQGQLSPQGSAEQAIESMLGLRGAEGSTPYLSLYWRVDGFAPPDFDAAVHIRGRVLRVRGPRGTYFWVTPGQAFSFLAAAQTEPLEHTLAQWGMERAEFERIRAAVTDALADAVLIRLTDLKRRLPAGLARPVSRKGQRPGTTVGVTLDQMALAGELVSLKEPGFDRHRPDLYYGDRRDVTRPNRLGLTRRLYPDVVLDGDPAAARCDLVRQYIWAYGPVQVADLVWWTGIGRREAETHLKTLAGEVNTVAVQGLPGLFLLHREAACPAAAHGPPAVHLLPGGDSAMKAYAGFDRFLYPDPFDHNRLRFQPAVLLNGVGVGTWGYRLTAGGITLVLELFREPSLPDADALQEAAVRYGCFIAGVKPDRVSLHLRLEDERWDPRRPFPLP